MNPSEPEHVAYLDLRDQPRIETFILRLETSNASRLVGSISRLSETSAIEFDGWIEFMTIIQELRAVAASVELPVPPA